MSREYDSASESSGRILTRLLRLVGTWRGAGNGRYPTIQPFEYLEELSFASNGVQPLLHYVQKTWLRRADGSAGKPLHCESGFLLVGEDGGVQMTNAQNGGRVEVLRGALAEDGPAGGFTLSLASVLFGNDERMLRTARSYVLAEGVLSYRVEMATTTTPAPVLELHLAATLIRSW